MSNTMIPIIIPVNTPSPRCPGCNNLENIKTVCCNCGYEYQDETYPKWKIIMWSAALLFGVYIFVTLIYWLCGYEFNNPPTLLEVFKMQWEWVKELRIW